MKKSALLIAFFLFLLKFGLSQTAISDPSGTSLATSGSGAAIARSGITYTYTNSSWPSSCIGWGFTKNNSSLGCIYGAVLGPPTGGGCNCSSYPFTSSQSISGNVAYLNRTATVRYYNGSSYVNGSVSARLKFTVTTTGGTAINFNEDNSKYWVPVTGDFKITVVMELQGPSGAVWNGTSQAGAWDGALDIYDNLGTDPSYNICTNFDFSQTTFYSIPTSSTIPTITNPSPCGGTVTSSGYTFQWTGTCTIHPDSHYEWRRNTSGWIDNGTSTSEWESLSVGANTFQVRYYDGCNEAYYTSSSCTIYYTPVNYCGNVDHGGNDWTISSNMTVSGNHTNIGNFQVNSGITATVSSSCHYFYVNAENVNVIGTINANGAGNAGGSGGIGGGMAYGDAGSGALWWSTGTDCNGGFPGAGGAAGSGTGGGNAGSNGGIGGCTSQECGGFLCIGNEDGEHGGGGGGGGGSGGSYGGSGGSGAHGGAGSQFGSSSAGGSYGTGGSQSSTYGTTSGDDITWGSGGGGAGGGGGAWGNGIAGGSGGSGGGVVSLVASNNCSVSGTITANGTNGGNGGNGSGESTANDFNCSVSGYNDCSLCPEASYDAAAGAGGGGSGGSGGGIKIESQCGQMNITGTLNANGGSGGTDGIPDPTYGDCFDFAQGGAGGGGGRIKIFYNPCNSNIISASVSRTGGSGGSGYSNGNSGNQGTYVATNYSAYDPFDPGSIASNQSICYNSPPAGLTSTTAASGGSCGSIVYQWMQCTSGCGSPPTNYSAISGATGATYNPPAITQNTYYVRRAVSDNCTDYSDVVTVAFYNTSIAEGTWVGATNTNWFECTNWGNGRVPTSIMNVIIPASCTYYPNIASGTGTCFNIDIVSGASLTISGGTLNITGTSGDLGYHGIDNYGTINISAGNLNVSRSIENRGGTINISNGNVSIAEYLYNMDGYNSVMNISGGTISCANLPNYQGTINHSAGSITTNGYYREQDAGGGNYYGSGTAEIIFNGTSNTYIRLMKAGSYFNNVNVNGAYYIEGSSTQHLDINGNLNIASTKSFDCSSRDIEIAGDFVNYGTYTAGSGTVTFNGASQQSITSNGSPFYNLIFNNTNGGNADILAMEDLRVSNSATLTSGIVSFANPIRKLILGNSATTNVGNANSFIDGIVEKTNCNSSFTFPTGNVNTRDIGSGMQTYKIWAPFTANPSSATTVNVRYLFSNDGLNQWWYHDWTHEAPLTHTSAREYWLVNSSSDLNATLYWKDNNPCLIHDFCYPGPTDFMHSDLTVAYWDNIWKDAGGSASTNYINGSITSSVLIPFGAKGERQITFGGKDPDIPLPAELSYFTAVCNNQNGIITWQTLSETNNDFFILEKSNGNEDFYEVARIKGAGSSNRVIDYLYTDNNLYSGDNYYRLTQVDFDGKQTVYNVITLNCDRSNDADATMYAYPNPFTDELNVVIENLTEPEFVLEIYDDLGRLVFTQKYENNSLQFRTKLNLKEYRPAVYNLRSISEGSVLNTRVVKR